MAAVQQMQLGRRQVARVRTRGFLRHVMIPGTPYGQRRGLAVGEVFPVLWEPGPILFQARDEVDGDRLAPRRDERPVQCPQIRRDALRDGFIAHSFPAGFPHGAAGLREIEGRVDQREVRERLRIIAGEGLGLGVVLFRQQADVVAQG